MADTGMGDPGTGRAPVGWRVTAQQETTAFDAAGAPRPIVRVTFQLDNGQSGTVDIPRATYSAATVRQAVTERAAVMADVAGLTG